jgi:hypothetical protein
MIVLAAAALSFATPALVQDQPAGDWWWVAGDSRDEAAVFAEAGSVRRNGDSASVTAVRIARDGSASDFSWRGRCGGVHADEEIAAVARFACGGDEDHMREAAMLGGLSPVDAARAIFSVTNRARGAAPVHAG